MKPTNSELISFFSQYVTANRFTRIQEVVQRRTRYITIALEDVYQSLNAGAIVRSCESMGIQDMHCIMYGNQFVVKKDIDQGASKWLSLYEYRNTSPEVQTPTAACINTLKKNGYKIVATSPHAVMTLSEIPIDQKLALLFGTELMGLTNESMECADYLVKIPMYGFSESFNVSVSVALCLYDFTTRLRASSINWHLSQQEQDTLILDWVRQSIDKPDLLEDEFYKRNPSFSRE
jgi:tRNA (guanosine-2'-O-)-methyltransferase